MMHPLDDLVIRSIREIRNCVSRYGSFYIMFSGGKDSLVCLDLYLKAVDKEALLGVVFVEMTGNTAPEAVEYVYSIARRLGVEDKLIHLKLPFDMLEKMKLWGVPTPRRRWCWGEKYRVWKSVKPPHHWVVGIKASDSAKRASPKWNRYVVILPDKKEVALQPIIEWSNEHVFRYIEKENLPLNPCYEKYGFCGVCMFCIFHDKRTIEKVMSDPYWRERIAKALLSIQRSKSSKFVEEVVKRWLKHVRSQRTIEEWLKSSRG